MFDGNRVFFQVSPPLAFLLEVFYVCYTSQSPVHLGKEVLDWHKWNVMTLQALVRNFLQINNFTTPSPCTAEALTPLCSLHSYPFQRYEWSGTEPVPSKKKNNSGVRTSAAQEIWLENYLLIFLWPVWSRGGGRGEEEAAYGGIVAFYFMDHSVGAGGHFVFS
jgi:hypothetical protein